nr:MAG: hypothetical protein E4H34_00335 [Hyphomicrobiales bacterium]
MEVQTPLDVQNALLGIGYMTIAVPLDGRGMEPIHKGGVMIRDLVSRTCWTRKLTVAVTAFALVFSQTAPALAYGPSDAFGGHDGIKATANFRIPLGTAQTDKDRTPSFGFTVQRQFQFNDPLYESMSGSYQISQRLTVNAMDLRFSMDGKLSGFDVGGFNAFQANTRLSAADNGDGGIPTWAWVTLGVVAVVGVALVVAKNNEPNLCPNGCPFFEGG